MITIGLAFNRDGWSRAVMDIMNQDALSLSKAIDRGQLSAAELMQATLARINAVNGKVNAIVSLRDADELMQEARAADDAPRKGWLHGIPMAIKDLSNAQGLRTTRGSPIYKDQVAESDDLFVARLRAAGALIIGKTNTPEFGLGSNTFNPVHGATCNPYDAGRSAGGSSGGAAVALAARMVSVADGSDMMGSLRNPAGWNNVYGMRPSWGAVPAEPLGDVFMHQLATSGPMARNPVDLALLADTMAGPDPRQPNNSIVGLTAPTIAQPLPAQRIAWLGDWGGALAYEAGISQISETALQQIEDLGHTVEAIPAPFDAERMWDSWITLRSFAVACGAQHDYNDPKKRALLKPAAIWEIERGNRLTALELHRASMIRSDWFRRTTELFAQYDALILPSAQCWPFDLTLDHPVEIAGVSMDTYHRWMQVVIPASLIGLPVVNIPAGFGDNGLPAGLQLIGPRASDGQLLRLAQEWHLATGWPDRKPPVLD
jgi:amidase